MNAKNVKISLAIFLALIVSSFAFFTAARENSSSDKSVFLDSDQDGLSDEEEKMYGTDSENRDTDGDGYSDGTEVKSGYDPLKPAPGDKIISHREKTELKAEPPAVTENIEDENKAENKNLTEEISTKIAELVSDSDSENQEITLEDIENLVWETTENEITFEDLPEIDEDKIKIKKQNYSHLSKEKREAKEKEDDLEYLTAVSYVAINNLPYKITSAEDLNKFMQEIMSQVSLFSTNLSDVSYFENLADHGEKALEQLEEIEVPENFLELHTRGLQLMNYAISLRDEARPNSQDPISSIAVLSKVQNFIVLSTDFLNKVNFEIEKIGISEIPLEL